MFAQKSFPLTKSLKGVTVNESPVGDERGYAFSFWEIKRTRGLESLNAFPDEGVMKIEKIPKAIVEKQSPEVAP